MAERDIYTFSIDGFTPETIPMNRLAEYMAELAKLLGTSERVHFQELKEGSVELIAYAEPQAVPKVRQRVAQVGDPNAPDDIRKPYERLNTLLRDDNTLGRLSVGGANVLQFPGRELPRVEAIGPFNEHTELDGVLVRIGGTDNTAHAQLQDAEGRTWRCEVTREIARELAQHLYGAPIRAAGIGRWVRTEDGVWDLLKLRLKDFRPLRDEDLPTVATRLRAVQGSEWLRSEDPLALLQSLRDSDEEMH